MLRDVYSIALNEVGIVPESSVTYSDSDIDLSVSIGDTKLGIPIISAAMDSVTSNKMLSYLTLCGGMGIINLCGLLCRYRLEEYDDINREIIAGKDLKTLQAIYNGRKPNLEVLKNNLQLMLDHNPAKGAIEKLAVSATPQNAVELFDVAREVGFKNMVIQSSFVSPFWKSKEHEGLNILEYIKFLHDAGCNVIVGNVASLNVAIPFISAGVDGIIMGIGPGNTCSTRTVLGIGSGHVSSIAAVREYIECHHSNTRVIADGGIHNSGDIIKLLCTGAHAVILGGMFARTEDAPFYGFHWGMSSFHHTLPRGDLLKFSVEDGITVARVLDGPSFKPDGTMAIIPAIKNALSNIGCLDINEAYFRTSVVRFPNMASEGHK